MKPEQLELFDVGEWWESEWQDMPEFIQDDLTPMQSILVHFKTEDDRLAFAKLLNQTITEKTKFIWYPELKAENLLKFSCEDES